MNRLLLLRATRGQVNSQIPAAVTTGSGGTSPYRLFDMSIIRRFLNHGRDLIRYHLQVYCNPAGPGGAAGKLPQSSPHLDPLVAPRRAGTVGPTGGARPRINPQNPPGSPIPFFSWIGQEVHAQVRQIFVNNVLNRVTNSLSAELKRKATQQLLYRNNSRPFFALLGVSLASGGGLLTRENEFEGICWEIRESLEKKQQLANAGVIPAAAAPAPVIDDSTKITVDNLEFGHLIAKGCSAAVYSARWKEMDQSSGSGAVTGSGFQTETDDEDRFPLGVKMMFNFYCESNSGAIIRAMCKEIVPAVSLPELPEAGVCKEDLENLQLCPPHPNIIQITHIFTDQIPLLPESMERYPDALPGRLNSDGLGRNMSLFLVMKKYSCNLRTYLQDHEDLKLKNRLLILAQLLEGVAHLGRNGIAHRDLKSDNILLDLSGEKEPEYPKVVITDFGCCLANKSTGLSLPFPSNETDRGGAAATMSPEVSTAVPGTWRKISYEKADAWSIGTIAYEIFGAINPFATRILDSRTYADSDLPIIPNVPPIINSLVHGLLKRQTNERLSAQTAATVCHISLFAPTRWLVPTAAGVDSGDSESISDSEIMQWLLTLTTKLLCQLPSEEMKLEYILIRTFLQRVRFGVVRAALDWIHMVNKV